MKGLNQEPNKTTLAEDFTIIFLLAFFVMLFCLLGCGKPKEPVAAGNVGGCYFGAYCVDFVDVKVGAPLSREDVEYFCETDLGGLPEHDGCPKTDVAAVCAGSELSGTIQVYTLYLSAFQTKENAEYVCKTAGLTLEEK